MFTGIVTHRGVLAARSERGGDLRLEFELPGGTLPECGAGDSIAVNGVCLTVLTADPGRFSVDASAETLQLTTLGALPLGGAVNLELALQAADRLGGHLVSGHVDGMARLVERRADGRAERLEFALPAELARYVAKKGSICLDGVSLTVNSVAGERFSVCIIPHTLAVTTLGELQAGGQVNVEVDMIARYLERLLAVK